MPGANLRATKISELQERIGCSLLTAHAHADAMQVPVVVKTETKTLRSFGLTVGGVFAVIALWPVLIRGSDPRIWAAIPAVLLIVPALVWPRSLSRIHRGWMSLAEVLAWVNTRIILGAVFYLIVTPIGAVRRLLGKDPMGTRAKADVESYRILRKPRSASHLKRQY